MRRLSRQQQELVQRLWDGASVKEAAALMGISPKTATTYLSRVRHRYGARTNITLMRGALKEGLVTV